MRLITGVARPRRTILGTDFAGEVEAIGAQVTTFAPGDRVFGLTPAGYGGHAEYLCWSQDEALALMPDGMDFHEAVVCEGAWYANSNLKALGVRSGHRILIYGASGAIGTAAVQLAKFYGAQVTAVVATRHLDLARSLGADHVIDYTRQDYTQIDETFDFILDAVGKASYFQCRRLLTPQGVFATTDLGPHNQNALLGALGNDFQKAAGDPRNASGQSKPRADAQSTPAGRRLPCSHRPAVPARGDRRRLPLRRDRPEDRNRRDRHAASEPARQGRLSFGRAPVCEPREGPMKAIASDRYGTADDLHLRDVAQPTPADDEVLVPRDRV